MIDRALHDKPADATRWSTHGMGEGISASAVSGWFRLSGRKPHPAKTCKLSADPSCIEKGRDIAPLYVDPPGHATVLWVDDQAQTQGLGRTQPQPARGQRRGRAAVSLPGSAAPHRAVSGGSSVRGSGSVPSPCGAACRGPGTAWWA